MAGRRQPTTAFFKAEYKGTFFKIFCSSTRAIFEDRLDEFVQDIGDDGDKAEHSEVKNRTDKLYFVGTHFHPDMEFSRVIDWAKTKGYLSEGQVGGEIDGKDMGQHGGDLEAKGEVALSKGSSAEELKRVLDREGIGNSEGRAAVLATDCKVSDWLTLSDAEWKEVLPTKLIATRKQLQRYLTSQGFILAINPTPRRVATALEDNADAETMIGALGLGRSPGIQARDQYIGSAARAILESHGETIRRFMELARDRRDVAQRLV